MKRFFLGLLFIGIWSLLVFIDTVFIHNYTNFVELLIYVIILFACITLLLILLLKRNLFPSVNCICKKLGVYLLLISLPFFILFLNVEGFRKATDIMYSPTPPVFGSYGDSPDYINLFYYIFSHNYLLYLFFLLIALFTFYFLSVRKDKIVRKVIMIIALEGILTGVLLIEMQSFIPLILLYNYSIIALLMLNNQKNKSIKVAFFIYTVFGVVINLLFMYNSLKDYDFAYENLMNDRLLTDLNYVQSISKFVLYNSLTKIYVSIFFLGMAYFICCFTYKFLNNLIKNKLIFTSLLKNGKTLLLVACFTIVFFRIIGLSISVLIIEQEPIIRDIQDINGCYASHLNLGPGKEYIGKDNLSFDMCFDTTNGIFTVYKEVERENRSYFDLIEEVTFKRIILFDDKGNEVISFDLTTMDVNIYVTTKGEVYEGYDNLITVEKKDNNSENAFPNYTIYDLSGKFVFELPYGFPDKQYVKTYRLDVTGFKLLFKEGRILFKALVDGKGVLNYYYLDGRIEPVDE